jgi:hypothetical protein
MLLVFVFASFDPSKKVPKPRMIPSGVRISAHVGQEVTFVRWPSLPASSPTSLLLNDFLILYSATPTIDASSPRLSNSGNEAGATGTHR